MIRRRGFSGTTLALVYLFLYLPILTLIVYSFNESKLVTVWSRFSFVWYRSLLQDEEILAAALLSLKIALLSATASVVLGTLAAFALVRYRHFRGRTLFSGMVAAPLVMPEIIIGLSLLLFMVSIQKAAGWPERGILTIWLGHTLVGMAYATVAIQARLRELDRALEEAAMDLGATPATVFRLITLPLIAQAVVSAWLLTFTLSMDDVIISSFLSGPGSTTLPMIVFARARLGLNPEVNAVATVIVAVVTLGAVGAGLYLARRQKRRQSELAEAFGGPDRGIR
jgi:putrescine transport system permease protein